MGFVKVSNEKKALPRSESPETLRVTTSSFMMQFAAAVILENIIAVAVNMIFSAIIGTQTKSALAAVGMANTVYSIFISAFSLMTVGSGVIMARLVGEEDYNGSSRIAEQTVFFTSVISTVISAVFYITARPFMRLFMANAAPDIFGEAVLFFKIMLLSFPLLMLFSAISCILRAAGNSRAPMIISVTMNLLHLIFSYLFIILFRAGIAGAGYSYLVCRIIGGAMIFIAVLRTHIGFAVTVKNIFLPDWKIFFRIFRIGFPAMIESLMVQFGYIIPNVIVVGLGTGEATVYQVASTIYAVTSIPQVIGSTIASTWVGQRIGAKDYAGAVRAERQLWWAGMGITCVLCLISCIFGEFFCSFYSDDPYIIRESAEMMWPQFALAAAALSINIVDPSIRAGGDSKGVMYTTLCGVWLIRIPLTYLFCYAFHFGVAGIFWANAISLTVRAIIGAIRFRRGKWMGIRV